MGRPDNCDIVAVLKRPISGAQLIAWAGCRRVCRPAVRSRRPRARPKITRSRPRSGGGRHALAHARDDDGVHDPNFRAPRSDFGDDPNSLVPKEPPVGHSGEIAPEDGRSGAADCGGDDLGYRSHES
jgi:hypothetical protein